MSVAAPIPVSVPAFKCVGCGHKRRLSRRHPSGFCDCCLRRGRNYWLDRFTLTEIVELASLLWPEDFYIEAAA